jgi:hypothetical protein
MTLQETVSTAFALLARCQKNYDWMMDAVGPALLFIILDRSVANYPETLAKMKSSMGDDETWDAFFNVVSLEHSARETPTREYRNIGETMLMMFVDEIGHVEKLHNMMSPGYTTGNYNWQRYVACMLITWRDLVNERIVQVYHDHDWFVTRKDSIFHKYDEDDSFFPY